MKMKNPLILASGIRGNNHYLLIRAAKQGAGAVTSKSYSIEPRQGHENPTAFMQGDVMINAMGLPNPGIGEGIKDIKKAVKGAKVPIIASIVGFSVKEFSQAAKRISEANPHMIEVDASCPNVGKGNKMFSWSIEDASAVASAVRSSTTIPFSMKLSPDVPNIGQIAKACVDSGADCITAVNAMGGMYIDAYAKKGILHNWFGGTSGPPLKPIALKSVYSIRKAIGPKIPIIGTGGVTTGIDAVEMIMAGATAVGVGTALVLRKDAFSGIAKEMESFMKKNKYSQISQLTLDE